jgi:hypothetical protein
MSTLTIKYNGRFQLTFIITLSVEDPLQDYKILFVQLLRLVIIFISFLIDSTKNMEFETKNTDIKLLLASYGPYTDRWKPFSQIVDGCNYPAEASVSILTTV